VASRGRRVNAKSNSCRETVCLTDHAVLLGIRFASFDAKGTATSLSFFLPSLQRAAGHAQNVQIEVTLGKWIKNAFVGGFYKT
jgi:hypothetical protein